MYTMSSSSVRTIERLRSEKNQQRERLWNSDVGFSSEKRRLVQMSSDIKGFILRSMTDPAETHKSIEKFQRKRQETVDSFAKISETLGFLHHDGTDPNLELKVVKIIMIREGLVMNLRYISDRAQKYKSIDGSNILELLFQLRETTLNYLEALCLWRQGSNQGDMPRAFLWESQNYTIKLISDMDFLSENPYIIAALNIPPEQLKSNPLMLSNNLEDFNTWMDPHERASQDTNGNISGPEFESRLRLRFAERVLLQEMELYNSSGESDIFITQGNDYSSNIPYQSHENSLTHEEGDKQIFIIHNSSPTEPPQEMSNIMIGSNILERDDYDPNFLATNPQSASETVRSSHYFEGERRVKTTESGVPQSRSSTASFGFSSAPSTSNGRSYNNGYDYFAGDWNEGKCDIFPFFESKIGENVGYHEATFDTEPEKVEENTHIPAVNFELMVQLDCDSKDCNNISRSGTSIDSLGDLDMKLIVALTPPPTCLVLAGSVCIILFAPKDEVNSLP